MDRITRETLLHRDYSFLQELATELGINPTLPKVKLVQLLLEKHRFGIPLFSQINTPVRIDEEEETEYRSAAPEPRTQDLAKRVIVSSPPKINPDFNGDEDKGPADLQHRQATPPSSEIYERYYADPLGYCSSPETSPEPAGDFYLRKAVESMESMSRFNKIALHHTRMANYKAKATVRRAKIVRRAIHQERANITRMSDYITFYRPVPLKWSYDDIWGYPIMMRQKESGEWEEIPSDEWEDNESLDGEDDEPLPPNFDRVVQSEDHDAQLPEPLANPQAVYPKNGEGSTSRTGAAKESPIVIAPDRAPSIDEGVPHPPRSELPSPNEFGDILRLPRLEIPQPQASQSTPHNHSPRIGDKRTAESPEDRSHPNKRRRLGGDFLDDGDRSPKFEDVPPEVLAKLRAEFPNGSYPPTVNDETFEDYVDSATVDVLLGEDTDPEVPPNFEDADENPFLPEELTRRASPKQDAVEEPKKTEGPPNATAGIPLFGPGAHRRRVALYKP